MPKQAMTAPPDKKKPASKTSRQEPVTLPAGFRVVAGAFSAAGQKSLMAEIESIILAAPLFQPTMPRTGKPFSVMMTNCGRLGWVSDRVGGYRYQTTHLVTGATWPPIPQVLLDLWTDLAGCEGLPEACLINYYPAGAKMGSHQDRDENEPRAPVLSVSLGDDAVFHVGGLKRTDPKVRLTLRSGDICLLGGPARFAFHGIDRVLPGTSDLVPGGGRLNLTLRRVTSFDGATVPVVQEGRPPSSNPPPSTKEY